MQEVVIDRAIWVNGNYGGESQLLNSLGEKCCLGFLGSACGYSDLQLKCVSLPWAAGARYNEDSNNWPIQLFMITNPNKDITSWKRVLSLINDYRFIDDQNREDWIAEGFKTILGYEVKFVGEYDSNKRRRSG